MSLYIWKKYIGQSYGRASSQHYMQTSKWCQYYLSLTNMVIQILWTDNVQKCISQFQYQINTIFGNQHLFLGVMSFYGPNGLSSIKRPYGIVFGVANQFYDPCECNEIAKRVFLVKQLFWIGVMAYQLLPMSPYAWHVILNMFEKTPLIVWWEVVVWYTW